MSQQVEGKSPFAHGDRSKQDKWHKLVSRCLWNRKNLSVFTYHAHELFKEAPVNARELATFLLTPSNVNYLDPLVPDYADGLLQESIFKPGDVLDVLLLRRKSWHTEEISEESVKQLTNRIKWRSMHENWVFAALTRLLSTTTPRPSPEVPRALRLLADWIAEMVMENASVVVQNACAVAEAAQSIHSSREHLGMLVVAMLSNEGYLALINSPAYVKSQSFVNWQVKCVLNNQFRSAGPRG